MANKTVLLINPKGGKLPFNCPLKLIKFLDNEFLQGALPDDWKWEVKKDKEITTVQYHEYKIKVFSPFNEYKIWDCEFDRCVYKSGSFDTIEDAISDAKFNIDESMEIPNDR